MLFSLLASIGFLLSHPNPSNHAKEFVQAYEEQGEECFVYTDNESVAKKFPGKAQIISIANDDDLQKAAEFLSTHDQVIADISIPQWQQVFCKVGASTKKIVYYDNPEKFVSTTYSTLAEKMVAVSDVILFSNHHHARVGILGGTKKPVDLTQIECVGLGFYSQSIADQMLDFSKEEKDAFRKQLFTSHSIEDRGQKILVIAGGANEEYYKAFFRFMLIARNILWDHHNLFDNTVFVLQQHPRAMQQGDKDGNCIKTAEMINQYNPSHNVHFVVSNLKTPQALALANTVVYYQTSMAPQFILGGVKKVIQMVDSVPNKDMLVSAGIPTVCNEVELRGAIRGSTSSVNKKTIVDKLGIDPNWKANLPK
ncbi:hypothetical protein K0U07_02100 [bacterium]|nr:hypothetical protein [bacterium]